MNTWEDVLLSFLIILSPKNSQLDRPQDEYDHYIAYLHIHISHKFSLYTDTFHSRTNSPEQIYKIPKFILPFSIYIQILLQDSKWIHKILAV